MRRLILATAVLLGTIAATPALAWDHRHGWGWRPAPSGYHPHHGYHRPYRDWGWHRPYRHHGHRGWDRPRRDHRWAWDGDDRRYRHRW